MFNSVDLQSILYEVSYRLDTNSLQHCSVFVCLINVKIMLTPAARFISMEDLYTIVGEEVRGDTMKKVLRFE
jgi:hypothetical protein